MNLLALRKVLIFAMMGISWLMLFVAPESPRASLVVALLTLPVAWRWEAPAVNLARWRRAWTALTLGLFAVLAALFALGQLPLLGALLYFVLFLAASKLFQREENKDYTQAMALSLLLVAAATVFNLDVSFGFFFLVYVLLACVALTTQHFAVELTEVHKRSPDRFLMERQLLVVTLGLALVVLAGSLAFFFIFPRVGFGFMATNERPGLQTAGFSDDVQLGDHGTIRGDRSIVMRVRFPDGEPADPRNLYWFGGAMDTFDGRRWTHTRRERRPMSYSQDLEMQILGPKPRRVSDEAWIADTLRTQIYLEPLDTDLLFAPGVLRGLSFPTMLQELPDSVFGRSLHATVGHRVELRTRSEYGVGYETRTVLNRPSIEAMREAWVGVNREAPEDISARQDRVELSTGWALTHYLQLPESGLTERTWALAAEIVENEATVYDKVLAIESWLRTRLQYTTTLDAPASPEEDVVDSFLFEWQRGHCEYFATAMVVLLRSQGIPSRIVNGYLGADFNDVGGFWVVRQGMAHSWVEVFFPGHGWVMFEPTPASAATFGNNLWNRLELVIDSVRMQWLMWVIEYDMEKQISIARDAVRAVTGGEDSVLSSDAQDTLRKVGWWLLRNLRGLVALGVLATLFMVLFRRRARARQPWSHQDWGLGVSWLALSVLVVLTLWRREVWPGYLLAVCLPTVGTLLAWRLRKEILEGPGERRRNHRARGAHEVSALYLKLLLGWERAAPEAVGPDTTPEGLCRLAAESRPDLADEMYAFVRLYEGVRFGGIEMDDATLREARRQVRAILSSLKRPARSR